MRLTFINFADSIAIKSGDQIVATLERVIDTKAQMTVWTYEPWTPNYIPNAEELKAIYAKLAELNNPPDLLSQRS